MGTLALAEYLARRKVSATFFVIAGWATGLSSDPGMGSAVYATGYERIPILPDLLRLGHRLGNHTAHHVLLSDADPREAAAELAESQRALDPLLTNELRLFRAPGGAWSATAAEALSGDPLLADLVGPVRWDVDRKDWEGSLWCRSDHPATECEPSSLAGRMRVKPRVTAERYLASIEEAKHGIVLLHDRVGHVGSDYAIEVARVLVPALEARGYVFAAPVLAFSALAPRPGVRLPSPLVGEGPAVRDAQGARTIDVAHALPDTDPRTLRFGDLNGDGRADACARGPRGVSCTLATPRGFATASPWMQQGMTDADGWSDASAARIASLGLVDVNGDGRADLCAASATGDLLCGLAP